MPALANPRHERFARLYVQLGTNRHAYAKAGYASPIPRDPSQSAAVDASAARLLKHARVKNRIAELQAMAANRHNVTVDSLVDELNDAKTHAVSLGQPSAEIAAIMGKAKITGNIIERRESGQPGDFSSAQSSDDVLALVRSELGDEMAEALKLLMQNGKSTDPEPTHDGSEAVN